MHTSSGSRPGRLRTRQWIGAAIDVAGVVVLVGHLARRIGVRKAVRGPAPGPIGLLIRADELGRRAMIASMARSVFRTQAPDALRPATLLTLIGAGSLVVLGVALISQHAFGIEPCPWCVVQRIVVILIAVVALLGAGLARGAARLVPAATGLLVFALAVGGMLSAWHQHTVAAKTLSCAFTWADRTLLSLQLDAIWPSVFKVGATCADAAKALLLGLPYEAWSGVWFALVALAALLVIVRAGRQGRR